MKRILLIVVMLANALALAQTASISGVVSDSAGAVVFGAEIVVTDADTGGVRTATSEASGTYSVPNLAVGRYRVEVKKQGFASFRVNDIVLTVDQAFTINPILKPGGSTEVVDVNATDLPPVDLESSQISNSKTL
jgi:Carboxypeptidase regulatory-like domain